MGAMCMRFYAINKLQNLIMVQNVGRSGIVVARLPAAREGPGSNRAADGSSCFHENHCDTRLWARAAH